MKKLKIGKRNIFIIECVLVWKGWCVNIFGTLWVRSSKSLNVTLVNHEMIHTAQQHELGYVFFYIFYLIEWLFRLLILRNVKKSYRAISFEREAYANANNLEYLKARKHFSWVKYFWNKTKRLSNKFRQSLFIVSIGKKIS